MISAWEEEERRVRSIQEKSERRRLERQRNVENAGEKTGEEEKENEELRHEEDPTVTRGEEEAIEGDGIDANKEDVTTEGEIQEEEKVRKRRESHNHERPVRQKSMNMNSHIYTIGIGAYIV